MIEKSETLIIDLLFFLGASLEKNRRTLGFAMTELKFDKYEFETNCFPAPKEVTKPPTSPNPPSTREMHALPEEDKCDSFGNKLLSV